MTQVHQDQPPPGGLVVAVSRAALQPGAGLDAVLLHPGLMPVTCHAAAAASAAGGSVSSVSAAHLPLTVNTATNMLPLGVVVNSDVAASLGKVRHLSPEMAKNILQQTAAAAAAASQYSTVSMLSSQLSYLSDRHKQSYCKQL